MHTILLGTLSFIAALALASILLEIHNLIEQRDRKRRRDKLWPKGSGGKEELGLEELADRERQRLRDRQARQERQAHLRRKD